jgi:N-acetylglucosaminyldiphosphoundecaprenol N-acetyl-beta-D-mannosaminyltransferase
MIQSRHILGVRVDATTYQDASRWIITQAGQRQSRYVCCACVSSIMAAHDSQACRDVMNQADLVTSDGMPLVWLLRHLGVGDATRVYGPDLTLSVLEAAAEAGIAVGFYGCSQAVLPELLRRVRARFPKINVAYADSPPFRPITPEEDQRTIRTICEAGVRILFVGLGAPKQDGWMHAHRGHIPAVMLGVGAAFDFLAGAKPQAPHWMQRSGLEWLFRLATEPKRLWRRYLSQNPRFAVLALTQILRERFT